MGALVDSVSEGVGGGGILVLPALEGGAGPGTGEEPGISDARGVGLVGGKEG